MIADWDSKDGGELVLMTQLEHCATFYSKYGFELTGTYAREGYSNWTMKRPKNGVKVSHELSPEGFPELSELSPEMRPLLEPPNS